MTARASPKTSELEEWDPRVPSHPCTQGSRELGPFAGEKAKDQLARRACGS